MNSNSLDGGEYGFVAEPSGPGTLVYIAGTAQGGWPISWLDSGGKSHPLHALPGVYWTLRFSADGKRLAFSLPRAQGEDIWVKDLDRDVPSRLSFLDSQNRWPTWTPDGKNIVFRSTNSAAPGLYWIRSDGSGEAQRLSDGKLNEAPYSFSPDGKRLAFSGNGNGGSLDIFTAALEGDSGRGATGVRLAKPERFLGTRFQERYPAFSPDGRWLAYQSNESGTFEVYVRPFPGPGGRWQISAGGGALPIWSRGKPELLFEAPDRRVMVTPYTVEGDSFAPGKPRVWSETRLVNNVLSNTSGTGANLFNYDLAPDGQRLAALIDEASEEKPPTHLTVLLNFFDELRRRAPVSAK